MVWEIVLMRQDKSSPWSRKSQKPWSSAKHFKCVSKCLSQYALLNGREADSVKDTLHPDLGELFYFAGAAGKSFGHHEQQVGVFYPLSME